MPRNAIMNMAAAMGDRKETGGVEERVKITLTKEPGSDTFHRSFEASSTTAAMNALGILTMDIARQLDIPVIHVITTLTLMLTDPGKPAGQDDR